MAREFMTHKNNVKKELKPFPEFDELGVSLNIIFAPHIVCYVVHHITDGVLCSSH